jgi:hypothetical protein
MYRIVHNEQTDSYRVEKRGLLGWAFVDDPQTGEYRGFEDLDAARAWIRQRTRGSNANRRWKVVTDCSA